MVKDEFKEVDAEFFTLCEQFHICATSAECFSDESLCVFHVDGVEFDGFTHKCTQCIHTQYIVTLSSLLLISGGTRRETTIVSGS